ncbi:MFS transporter [Streptomyces bomunensis]|uniref:MFS transporter n=2 Tax=Streptomyces montanisoli TaxID=2798581 RepID=A0A940M6K1_9ACTN|nr:MFS transporter [Streptomyces montanisoli]
MALLALCPFLVLTTATTLFQQQLEHDLGAGMFGLQVTSGLANAGYAFGAVVAADVYHRVSRRRLYLGCEIGFVCSSLLALSAQGIVAFAVGMIFQGVATGMLLVAALPPLVTTHGAKKLPATAAIVNLGLFGVVTLGPLVGGLAGSFHGWRPLYAAVAALGAAAVGVGLLAFEDSEPPEPGMRFDWLAIPLAFGGTFLPFFGVSWLTRGSFGSPLFIGPVVVGVGCVTALVVAQYRKAEPLMPVKLISNTLPVTGTGGAMLVGAAFTALLELAELYLMQGKGYAPVLVGLLVTAQLPGIALAAWLFKRALPTRWTPWLALSGLLAVMAGAALLLFLSPANAQVITPVAAVLLGYGAGAGVAPGLFMAGLSVPSTSIGPTFALVELLRSEAAFLLAPLLLAVAQTAGSLVAGVHLAVVITLAVCAAGGCALVAVYLLGGARPHPPDLEGWIDGDATAYHSPPLADTVRDT